MTDHLPRLLAPREDEIQQILLNFRDSKSEPLSNYADYLPKNSVCLRLMNDEIHEPRIPTVEEAQRCLNEVFTSDKRRKINAPLAVTSESFIAKRSSFTTCELNRLFSYLASARNKKPLIEEDVKFFLAHQQQLFEEQESFLTYAKQQWLISKHKRHCEIKDDVLKFVNECWKAKLERAKRWPKYYEEVRSVPLALETQVSLTFMSTVVTIGCKKLRPYRYHDILNDRLNFHDIVSSLTPDRNERRPTGYFKCLKRFTSRKNFDSDIDRDLNASNIALENDVHIAMSESAFLTLINNHSGIIQPWLLPVVIKELTMGESSKKVVFIGSRLPPREMNTSDRVKYFAKTSADALLLSRPVRAYDRESDNLGENIEKLLELENFGISEDVVNSSRHKNDGVDGSTENDTEKLPRVAITEIQTKYNLFECAPVESCNILMKNALKNKYNILIRTTDKGCYNSNGIPCKISPKLEYQSELGFEIMTPQELSQEWSRLFLRPKGKLKRVRLNPVSGELLRIENFTIDDLSQEWTRVHSVNPNVKLGIVYNVVNSLWSLPVGNYLIARPANQSTVASIYKENPNSRSFNLYEFYQRSNPEMVSPERAVWVPLDTVNLSPVAYFFNRPPCTFTPRRKDDNTFRRNGRKRDGKSQSSGSSIKRRMKRMKKKATPV